MLPAMGHSPGYGRRGWCGTSPPPGAVITLTSWAGSSHHVSAPVVYKPLAGKSHLNFASTTKHRNQVVSKCIFKKQQMRWTPRGAHLLL